jgi:hypothetical protein
MGLCNSVAQVAACQSEDIPEEAADDEDAVVPSRVRDEESVKQAMTPIFL